MQDLEIIPRELEGVQLKMRLRSSEHRRFDNRIHIVHTDIVIRHLHSKKKKSDN